MPLPTAERVRELFDYDPDEGVLIWVAPGKGRRVGDAVTCRDRGGYVCVKVDQVKLYAHRVIWLWMTGEWPESEVDHEDRVRHNNAWLNLRHATPKQQAENRKLYVNSTSGASGVRWHQGKDKWVAYISHLGAYVWLGAHDTLIDAVAARLRAERTLYTHSPLN